MPSAESYSRTCGPQSSDGLRCPTAAAPQGPPERAAPLGEVETGRVGVQPGAAPRQPCARVRDAGRTHAAAGLDRDHSQQDGPVITAAAAHTRAYRRLMGRRLRRAQPGRLTGHRSTAVGWSGSPRRGHRTPRLARGRRRRGRAGAAAPAVGRPRPPCPAGCRSASRSAWRRAGRSAPPCRWPARAGSRARRPARRAAAGSTTSTDVDPRGRQGGRDERGRVVAVQSTMSIFSPCSSDITARTRWPIGPMQAPLALIPARWTGRRSWCGARPRGRARRSRRCRPRSPAPRARTACGPGSGGCGRAGSAGPCRPLRTATTKQRSRSPWA